jgi:hypothetical protein
MSALAPDLEEYTGITIIQIDAMSITTSGYLETLEIQTNDENFVSASNIFVNNINVTALLSDGTYSGLSEYSLSSGIKVILQTDLSLVYPNYMELGYTAFET